MKLKTLKVVSTQKNVFGEHFVDRTYYVIYRTLFFGLFRRYLHLHDFDLHFVDGSVRVSWWSSLDYATTFHYQHKAEAVIRDIDANPNKYFQ